VRRFERATRTLRVEQRTARRSRPGLSRRRLDENVERIDEVVGVAGRVAAPIA
jgi:hypothetical protein